MLMTTALAIEGGTPVRATPFPPWPVHDERELRGLRGVLGVLEGGRARHVVSERRQIDSREETPWAG